VSARPPESGKNARPALSICIVTWNTREMLDDCLRSIAEAPDAVSREVIVVDNASADGTAAMIRERHPQVTLIENAENLGYAAANNQALERAVAPLKLLLNPDIIVHRGSLDSLVTLMQRRPQAGAVAPRLLFPDGKVQASCRAFPTPDTVLYEALGLSRLFPHSQRFGKYRMTWWGYDEERTVEQPMASALLLRQRALDEIGLMDEDFPIFFNDVDLCKRLSEAGWEIWFTPAATMTHFGGASTSQVQQAMIAESHRSFLRFYAKHYRSALPSWQYHGVRALLRAGGAIRRALGWARGLVSRGRQRGV